VNGLRETGPRPDVSASLRLRVTAFVENDTALRRPAPLVILNAALQGFGPGFTELMGLPPLTPSAIARRMSTSTTSLLPTTFTVTPFISRLLRRIALIT
jgi:hypothetical protein